MKHTFKIIALLLTGAILFHGCGKEIELEITPVETPGQPVIETTWHRVIARDSPDNADTFRISKGDQVHVIGRLRVQRYTGADGMERTVMEVVASKVNSTVE